MVEVMILYLSFKGGNFCRLFLHRAGYLSSLALPLKPKAFPRTIYFMCYPGSHNY
ncbi:hypothetical protein Plhal304r1_c059g0147741 [Plasmopara halstedii]